MIAADPSIDDAGVKSELTCYIVNVLWTTPGVPRATVSMVRRGLSRQNRRLVRTQISRANVARETEPH